MFFDKLKVVLTNVDMLSHQFVCKYFYQCN